MFRGSGGGRIMSDKEENCYEEAEKFRKVRTAVLSEDSQRRTEDGGRQTTANDGRRRPTTPQRAPTTIGGWCSEQKPAGITKTPKPLLRVQVGGSG